MITYSFNKSGRNTYRLSKRFMLVTCIPPIRHWFKLVTIDYSCDNGRRLILPFCLIEWDKY